MSARITADDLHWFESAFNAWQCGDIEGALDGLNSAVDYFTPSAPVAPASISDAPFWFLAKYVGPDSEKRDWFSTGKADWKNVKQHISMPLYAAPTQSTQQPVNDKAGAVNPAASHVNQKADCVNEDSQQPDAAQPVKWRCFHCNEILVTPESATEHFGKSEIQQPACAIDVAEYRAMEVRMRSYCEEDTDLHRTIYRLQSEHAQALRSEEEKGYARGLADAAPVPPPQVAQGDERECSPMFESHCAMSLPPASLVVRLSEVRALKQFYELSRQPSAVDATPVFVLPITVAEIIDGAFLPANPNKLRNASEDTKAAAKHFKECLAIVKEKRRAALATKGTK